MEEARQHSTVSELRYRTLALLSAVAFFAACIGWIAFGPETHGLAGRLLSHDGELTFIAYFAILCGAVPGAILLPHLARAIRGRPAVELHQTFLRLLIAPHETIPLGEIEKIVVGDGKIVIFRRGMPARKLNGRILENPRSFFFGDVRDRFASDNVVMEES
jgi:hypothetical protein